ncbi:hypothetical protein FRC12_017068 [Ceratobasidium sp. 428]|nr:hypothetical protein FRC12_017068 [Ceratobasidium sp. 428]
MHNNLATAAHVNRLPPEVLAKIFALSKSYCVLQAQLGVDNFTCVCKYWRQTAMGALDLWTHIDIGPNYTSTYPADQLLHRSKNAPVHLHLFEPALKAEETVSSDRISDYGYAVEFARAFIVSHLHRVRTLCIESSNRRGRGFVSTILNLWFRRGTIEFPTSLALILPEYSDVLTVEGRSETFENMQRMLLSVRTLHLDWAKFDWDSNVYRNLVDLRIKLNSISISQLAQILSANPALTTLKLAVTQLVYEDGPIELPPVILEHLEVLMAAAMKLEYVISMLSLITLPGPPIQFYGVPSSNLLKDSRFFDFCSRSKIATLYCWDGDQLPPEFFQHLPYLRTLILHNFNLSTAPNSQSSTTATSLAPLSRPFDIILLGCTIDFEPLKQLVINSSTRKLQLQQCRVRNIAGSRQDIHEIRTLLLEAYPSLQCLISDFDSTQKLACRRIFD